MKLALIQFTGSDDPTDNRARLRRMIGQAAEDGAGFIATPEVSNCISASRRHQNAVLTTEEDDTVLAMMREEADRLRVTLLAGSLALKVEDDERFVNRSLLIGPDGGVRARYDKIHMFDVTISENENYQESAGFRPGNQAVLASLDENWRLGMTICYDLRFPALFAALANAGANLITVPSAFTRPTGAAHWEVLLRARAIETGAYILAPAQCGRHSAQRGKPRETYGHSMVVDPWGKVIAQAREDEQILIAEIDASIPSETRAKIPSLNHRRDFKIMD